MRLLVLLVQKYAADNRLDLEAWCTAIAIEIAAAAAIAAALPRCQRPSPGLIYVCDLYSLLGLSVLMSPLFCTFHGSVSS